MVDQFPGTGKSPPFLIQIQEILLGRTVYARKNQAAGKII
jgi:hypothetical protein